MQVIKLNLYVLNKNKFRKVIPFHKECIITEDDNLPEISLVIPSPIPKENNGSISLILKCANAKIKAEIVIPKIIPNSLDKIGNKTPLKITSSNNGAKNVVVNNKRINDKKLLLFKTISSKGLLPLRLSIKIFIINDTKKTKGVIVKNPLNP